MVWSLMNYDTVIKMSESNSIRALRLYIYVDKFPLIKSSVSLVLLGLCNGKISPASVFIIVAF